jgi:hypothetical protein
MKTKKLNRSEWQSWFDVNTRKLQQMEALIEVVSHTLGDQIESDWAQLHGITYDSKDD